MAASQAGFFGGAVFGHVAGHQQQLFGRAVAAFQVLEAGIPNAAVVAVAEAVFALRHGVQAQRGLQVGADQGALLGAEQVLGLAA